VSGVRHIGADAGPGDPSTAKSAPGSADNVLAMSGERTIDGWQLRLKSCGRGRYLGAGVLALWLCGWTVGEVFVLAILISGAVSLLTGRPPGPGREPLELGPALMAGAFLALWLTMWTIGGVAALTELMRVLWGEDRITVAAGRLTVTWAGGPFRSARSFERDAIRGVGLVGREDRIALETSRKRVELSRLGTRAERIEGAKARRAELHVSEAATVGIPPAWEEVITPEGERALVSNLSVRRTQARVASAITMGLAVVTFLVARESIGRPDLMVGAAILFVFTLAIAAGTLWLARGRWEWRIGNGRLTLRKRFGARVSDVFEGRRLRLEMSTDSDGDASVILQAAAEEAPSPAPAAIQWRSRPPKNSRIVAQSTDDGSVRKLAAWFAQATGLELDDLTTPQAREAQIAELRALLEGSGRFGRWAAKLVDRLEERAKKAG
jgi:hypothetical protein